MVGTFEELQHFSLQSISRRASDILDTTLSVMSAKAPPESVGAAGNLEVHSIKAMVFICFLLPYSEANQVLNCFQTQL